MCFQSARLRFNWWLQIDGLSYPMWEDHKVLYGYSGENCKKNVTEKNVKHLAFSQMIVTEAASLFPISYLFGFFFLSHFLRWPCVSVLQRFPHSWRLMQCLGSHCTAAFLALWPWLGAVISACQSGPPWSSAHESARGQLLCVSDLWALLQEGF